MSAAVNPYGYGGRDWREGHELVANAVRGRAISLKGWVRVHCPLCDIAKGTPDRKSSFGFHVGSLRFECYRCGTSGKLREPPESYAHVRLDEPAARAPILGPPESYVPLASEDARRSLVLAPARAYVLQTRGLSEALTARARVGACYAGLFAGRVILPVLAEDGAWLWYVGRAWHKNTDKPYLYPRGGRQGVLFNHAALRVPTDVPALVVEGCFDALAHDPDAVAVLGKPTPANVDALLAARRPIAIVLDGDAHEEGWALAMRLRLYGQHAGSVKLPPRVDPDEIPRDVLADACARAVRDGEVVL